MKRILACFLLCITVSCLAANKSNPAGIWRTVDDHSHKVASLVQLWQHQGKIYGKIIKIYPVDGNKSTDLCWKCPGELHNKPVLGITFLWDLKRSGQFTWNYGRIMDPKIGSIYRAKITLASDGKRLFVRGYIGIPLLGRTQTWYRVK